MGLLLENPCSLTAVPLALGLDFGLNVGLEMCGSRPVRRFELGRFTSELFLDFDLGSRSNSSHSFWLPSISGEITSVLGAIETAMHDNVSV